jgi:GH24 family phage-related lysozyme (muramidase)
MTVTNWSEQGEIFTLDNEACPERAFKDSGGVVTVGPGLTELDPLFKAYWRQKMGRAMRVGDTLPRAEAMKVFRTIVTERYLPAVVQNVQPQTQEHLDGSVDVAWNCGVGATQWNWAKALRAGNVAQAAKLLLTTAITVNHTKVVQGLIARRKREAALIEHGDYGNGPSVAGTGGKKAAGISTSPEAIKEYQGWLKTLGLYTGNLDGKAGKGSLTEGAVMNFQRMTPGLKVDGVVGPATRSALIRAVNHKTQAISVLGGGTASGGGLLGLHLDPTWIIGGAVVVILLLVVGFYLYNNRGVILRQRTPA